MSDKKIIENEYLSDFVSKFEKDNLVVFSNEDKINLMVEFVTFYNESPKTLWEKHAKKACEKVKREQKK